LNFSLGNVEIWGPRAVLDQLIIFFIHALDQNGLLDIEPVKLNPAWRNLWTGEDMVAKRLDRFLVGENLAGSLDLVRQWVSCGGELDHTPIVIEMRGRGRKPLIPFKFNRNWRPYDANVHEFVAVHFVENLKIIKQSTITWVVAKKSMDEQELVELEHHI